MSDVRRSALRRFADDFAQGAYWDAHEHLETLWRSDRDPLWQALVQLAATFVLIHSARVAGAQRVLARAQHKLGPLPASHHGVDVAWLRRQYAALATRLAAAPEPAACGSLFAELDARLGLRGASGAV